MSDPPDRSLYASFLPAVQAAAEVGGNDILTRLGALIRELDEADDDFLQRSRANLSKLLDEPHMALDGVRTQEFVQRLGETHFYTLCKARGLDLAAVKTAEGKKTPDFRTVSEPVAYFEVKTPSFRDGHRAISNLVDRAFEASVKTQRQLDAGRRVAISEHVIQPYGPVEHELRLTHVIQTLQNKIRQNVHVGQFAASPTYLVCNLLMLPAYGTTAEILRPTYFSHASRDSVQPVTGELWMAAFAEPGMLIQSEPEFEGLPSIEGKTATIGLLADETYDFIAGIVFVFYDLGGNSEPLALLRSEDDLTDTLFQLVGDNWNDMQDANGWACDDARLPRTVLDDVTHQRVDARYVQRRVKHWEHDVRRLYGLIESWLPKGWSSERGKAVHMHEELMQRFELPPTSIPTLRLIHREGGSAVLEPRSLWAIGANGRVDMTFREEHYHLLNVASNFCPPIWRVRAASHRDHDEPISHQWLRRVLGD